MSQILKYLMFEAEQEDKRSDDLSVGIEVLNIIEEYQFLTKKRLTLGNEGFAKDFFNKLKNWYQSIFNTSKKLRDKGEELLKKFKNIENDSNPKENELAISLKGLLSKDESFDDLIEVLNNTITESKTFLADNVVIKLVKDMDKTFEDILEKEGIGERDFGTFTSYAKEIAETFKKIMSLPKTKGDNKIPQGMEVEGYKVTKFGSLLGNKAIYSFQPLNNFQITEKDASFFDVDFYKSFSKAGLILGDYGENKDKEENIPVPNADTMINILEKTLELCDILGEHEKISNDIIKTQTHINNIFRELFASVIEWNDENEEQFEKDEEVRKIFDLVPQRIWEILEEPSKSIAQNILKGSAQIFSIAEKVLKT